MLWAVCRPPARAAAVWFPYSSERRAPLPAGPWVAAVNHLSHLDPVMAGLALRRPVRFLALDELWGNAAVLDVVFRAFRAIPMPREGRYPVGALREALRHLAAGGVIGMFPEGRRVRCWGDVPLERGAAWLALRAGVPIVPVAVWGTQYAMPIERLRLRRAPIRVVVGSAVDPEGFAGRDDPVGALTEAVREVLDREISRSAAAVRPRRRRSRSKIRGKTPRPM